MAVDEKIASPPGAPEEDYGDVMSHWRLAWEKFRTRKMALAGGAVLLLLILFSVFADVLVPHNPVLQRLDMRLMPPGTVAPDGSLFLLGTDQFGRDVLSRTLIGSRVSLLVGFVSVVFAGLIGLWLGLVSGYYGGWTDDIIMRIADTQLAFPRILLALTIIALVGASTGNIIVVMVVTSWVPYARLVRSSVLSIKEMDFVVSARAVGKRSFGILVQHILPHTLAATVILASYQVARLIILEASLGFLGLGVQPPEPTWGNMISDGRNYLHAAWWVGTFPGLMMMLTVLAINLLGDGIRDALDPKTRLDS